MVTKNKSWKGIWMGEDCWILTKEEGAYLYLKPTPFRPKPHLHLGLDPLGAWACKKGKSKIFLDAQSFLGFGIDLFHVPSWRWPTRHVLRTCQAAQIVGTMTPYRVRHGLSKKEAIMESNLGGMTKSSSCNARGALRYLLPYDTSFFPKKRLEERFFLGGWALGHSSLALCAL